MNLTLISPLGFLAGLTALAGGLFLLQRLRVRHREVDVVTTLFWHEAVHDARARVLVDRFRHPWAYALVLIIAGLLWSAVAAPEPDRDPKSSVVLVLDASAAAGDATAFASAKEELLAQVRTFDKNAREVLVSGAAPLTLLRRGEEALLLEARLEEVEQVASPSRVIETLESLALEDRGPTQILVFDQTPLDAARLALLPDRLHVEEPLLARMRSEDRVPFKNAGVVALGIVEAESGAWDAVDVLVEVRFTNEQVPSLVLSVDGKSIAAKAVTSSKPTSATSRVYRLVDLPARGGRFEARLGSGAGTELDDVATIMLPDRKALRVQLSAEIEPGLRATLRAVLDNDPSVAVVESEASIVVRRADERFGTGLPALVLGSAATQEESFLVTHEAGRSSEEVLAEVTGPLALAQIDATSLADAANTAITLGARATEGGPESREIAVWEELLGDGFDFTASRAFPLFVGGSLRWLSGAEELRPWVAAGETAIDTDRLQRTEGRIEVALDGSAVPPLAGRYTAASGEEIAASILSPGVTVPNRSEAASPDDRIQVAASSFDPVSWILVLALVLLLFEWRQVRTGRMP